MEKLGLFNLIINFNSRIFLILQKSYIYEEVVLISSLTVYFVLKNLLRDIEWLSLSWGLCSVHRIYMVFIPLHNISNTKVPLVFYSQSFSASFQFSMWKTSDFFLNKKSSIR